MGKIHKIGKEGKKKKKKKPLNMREEDNYQEKGISQKAKGFLAMTTQYVHA